MRFNEKQKIIITAGIFLILVGGLGALNYFKFKGRSELLAQLDKFSAEEQALTAKIKQIPDLREKRAKLINIIDQYVEILPKEEHVQHEAFMEIIDAYRKDTKIIIQKAEYVKKKDDEKSPKQENFIRHRYKFKLLGTVPDFIEFVNKIENHTRFLKVDTIKIRPLGTLEESGEDLGEKPDDDELTAASEPVKEIELTVSTYTYSRGQAKKV
ncbi:MAG TPA: hypothetical protein VFD71_15155 [Planctomycetota bacterium]|jgi:hypothetical protein|nr:hypothetical protein [Planctomycetota bacterium]